MVRKVKAANELWHKMLGSIDTPEKFAEKRAELAQNEWRRMKDNDSQECRNCHDANYFSYSMQGYRAEAQHNEGLKKGQTCIDCHKGIAHNMPAGIPPEVLHPPLPVAQTQENPENAQNPQN
jgi:cytochrome c-type protein NapC